MIKIDFRKMVANVKTDSEISEQEVMVLEAEKMAEQIIRSGSGSIIIGNGIELNGFEEVAVTIDTFSSVIKHVDGTVEKGVIFELIDNGHFIDIPVWPAHEYIEISRKDNDTDSDVLIEVKHFS
jgi:hypothetical protein